MKRIGSGWKGEKIAMYTCRRFTTPGYIASLFTALFYKRCARTRACGITQLPVVKASPLRLVWLMKGEGEKRAWRGDEERSERDDVEESENRSRTCDVHKLQLYWSQKYKSIRILSDKEILIGSACKFFICINIKISWDKQTLLTFYIFISR